MLRSIIDGMNKFTEALGFLLAKILEDILVNDVFTSISNFW